MSDEEVIQPIFDNSILIYANQNTSHAILSVWTQKARVDYFVVKGNLIIDQLWLQRIIAR